MIVPADADPNHAEASVAFERFYRGNYRSVVLLAFTTTRSTEEAEGIAQEAFLQLYRRWDRVTARERWVRRATVSLSTSWVRRRVAERAVVRKEASRLGGDSYEIDATSGADMARLLSLLPPRQRMAVILRYVDDQSDRDIAEVLGCRPGTVKSMLYRARESLRMEVSHEQRR